MRQIHGYSLWLGSVADVRDLRRVFAAEIEAVVDLALNEPVPLLTRELAYCRFPLVDGAGNPPWLLRVAVEAVAGFVRAGVPALVFCSAGMSRTPAIAACGIARACSLSPSACLALVTADAPRDVSGGLWADLLALG